MIYYYQVRLQPNTHNTLIFRSKRNVKLKYLYLFKIILLLYLLLFIIYYIYYLLLLLNYYIKIFIFKIFKIRQQ